jgi:hypothetical protein
MNEKLSLFFPHVKYIIERKETELALNCDALQI